MAKGNERLTQGDRSLSMIYATWQSQVDRREAKKDKLARQVVQSLSTGRQGRAQKLGGRLAKVYQTQTEDEIDLELTANVDSIDDHPQEPDDPSVHFYDKSDD